MNNPLYLLSAIAFAMLYDWLQARQLANGYSDFDYRYWPLSRQHKVALAALLIAAIYLWATFGIINPVWTVGPVPAFWMIWLLATRNDLKAQRAIGYRKPPKYSDGEYGA